MILVMGYVKARLLPLQLVILKNYEKDTFLLYSSSLLISILLLLLLLFECRFGSTFKQIQFQRLLMKAWGLKTLKKLLELFRWVYCVLKNHHLYVLAWQWWFKCLKIRMIICQCHPSLLLLMNVWNHLHRLLLPVDDLLVYLIYVHSTVLKKLTLNDSSFIFIRLSISPFFFWDYFSCYLCLQCLT